MKQIIKIVSSPKIFVYTIIWLMVLVVLGTLAQRDIGLYASQQKYFSANITWLGGIIPVPGGRITMIIMLVNLTFMVLFKQNLWKIKTIGVLIMHIGALLLLIGGGLTAIFSSEGNMVIEEGAQSNRVDDYHDMELTIINTSNESLDKYTVFDQPILGKGNILSHENLNFNIEIINQSLYDLDPKIINSFDIVICEGVLHHTFNPLEGLNIILKNLKKDADRKSVV